MSTLPRFSLVVLADFDVFNSPGMRAFLKDQRVQLISYKHLKLLDGVRTEKAAARR
jgi:hypothetical protein